MPRPHEPPLLSIGEFATATQLSTKALRLYDDQELLTPTSVDPSTGYRFYDRGQVATGRLVRVMREMNLSLAQIGSVLAAGKPEAERLLVEFAQACDRRYAAEKRAFQVALAAMRGTKPATVPEIEVRERTSSTVCVSPFLADENSFLRRYRAETARVRIRIAGTDLRITGEPVCTLLDPLSPEEGHLEVIFPVHHSTSIPDGMTLRARPASRVAILPLHMTSDSARHMTAALDSIFDWFDRSSYQASEPPSFKMHPDSAQGQLLWAFEARAAP